MKNHIRKIKSTTSALAKLACGLRVLRLHPKFRWLSYVCPIVRKRSASSRLTVSPSRPLAPPEGPPKLRLRKRRRLSVRSTSNRQP